MQSFARPIKNVIAFALMGMALTATAFAAGQSLQGTPYIKLKKAEDGKQALVIQVKPRMLELKALPAYRIERLNKDARDKYDQAMKAVDKINYEKAIDLFQQSIKAQPDDVYLRNSLVTLAQYMGDSHVGRDPNNTSMEGIKYYDIAVENLTAMMASKSLNPREKQRAQAALDAIAGLRQSVSEREEKRQATGLEIVKQYSKESFKALDKRERDRKAKQEEVQDYVKTVNMNPSAAHPLARQPIQLTRTATVAPTVGTAGTSRRGR